MRVLLLVSGATKTVNRLIGHPNLGVLIVPRAGNSPPPKGVVWACDNGAFNGFDDCLFRRMLKRVSLRIDCKWIACPDVVGDHEETLRLWYKWTGVISETGIDAAFVAQDGQTVEAIPWGRGLGAVFIGGSTRWKLGSEVARIIHAAKRRRVWVHMGRVNTVRRLMYAQTLGVDSVDGTQFSRWSETYLPATLDYLAQLDKQYMIPLAEPW